LFIKYAERERERERERDNNGPKGMGMEGQFRKLTNKIMQTSTRKNSNKKKKLKYLYGKVHKFSNTTRAGKTSKRVKGRKG